jgi:hypothetical protein
MVVIRLKGDHQLGSDHVDGLAPVIYIIDHANNHTSKSEIPYSLPWKEEYGTHIRGGTSALPVPGKDYYLLFFHTRQNGPAFGVGHYFPGILLFGWSVIVISVFFIIVYLCKFCWSAFFVYEKVFYDP